MKLKRRNCLICDRITKNYLNICDCCYELLVPKKEGVVHNFKYLDRAYSCFYYSPLVQDILGSYKYGNQRYFAHLFAELLMEKILELKLYQEIDLIIPVPIHKETRIKRGFNQTELLTEIIGESLNKNTLTDILIKSKYTREQASLDSADRMENLKDAFNVQNPNKIKDKSILLIDDVITTGSTVEECGKTLKISGCKRVIALSIATTT